MTTLSKFSPSKISRSKISLSVKARRACAALVAASTLGLAAAPSAANAGGWHGHHHGYGYGAAAIGSGLLLGAIIADSRPVYAYDDGYRRVRNCWTERRSYENRWGDYVSKRVRVCN